MERILVYDFNLRYGGIALGIPLATVEFAVLDMLGRIAGKPVEESIELIRKAVSGYDVRALKIKIGGLMFMTTDMNAGENAGQHHEFKGFRTRVRSECPASPLRVSRGKIKVPAGPGFGVEFDADWAKKHRGLKL